MERDMLITMQFDVTAPSAYRFLERYRRLNSVVYANEKVFFLAQYLQEISLLDASLLSYNPSEIAASALILASKCLQKLHIWNREIEEASGYSYEHLQPIQHFKCMQAALRTDLGRIRHHASRFERAGFLNRSWS